MAKFYSFPAQSASEECPLVPRAVRIFGESLGDATAKLRGALKDDPELKLPHPEFDKAEQEKPRKKPSTPSK